MQLLQPGQEKPIWAVRSSGRSAGNRCMYRVTVIHPCLGFSFQVTIALQWITRSIQGKVVPVSCYHGCFLAVVCWAGCLGLLKAVTLYYSSLLRRGSTLSLNRSDAEAAAGYLRGAVGPVNRSSVSVSSLPRSPALTMRSMTTDYSRVSTVMLSWPQIQLILNKMAWLVSGLLHKFVAQKGQAWHRRLCFFLNSAGTSEDLY